MEQQPETEPTEPATTEPTEESPAPEPDPPSEPPAPPVLPAPTPEAGRRMALYVLASGPRMGQTVAVYPMNGGVDAQGNPAWADLALVETPAIKVQTKSPYSKGKEPGTWHWA